MDINYKLVLGKTLSLIDRVGETAPNTVVNPAYAFRLGVGLFGRKLPRRTGEDKMKIQKWKWMPRELTKEMMDAEYINTSCGETPYIPTKQDYYEVMYDAAPALEEEPVAYRFFDSVWGAYMYNDKPFKDRTNQPLYTHAAEDKLRKAVTELLLVWDSRSYKDIEVEMDLLRAALEEE